MRRASRVVLDTNDVVWAWLLTYEVDQSYTLLVPSSAESNGDSSMAVTAAFSSERNGELAERSTLVEVWCERAA